MDMHSPAPPAFLAGGGEMGALIRAADWASTPLGSPASWPPALRYSVRLMLNSGHPMYIFWGEDSLCFYNDAYRQSIGPERHPGSLGQPARLVWAEIWDMIGSQIALVMSGGGTTWHENQLVPITRNGRREDVYWTYSFSPIDDDRAPGEVIGVMVVTQETTQTVRTQEALANSEARFRAALQVTGIMWTNDATGRMVGEQPGWSALTGQTQDEHTGYGWSDALHPDDAQPTLDAWHQALAGPTMFLFEHRVRVRDGSYRRFAIRAIPAFGADGILREWVGVHIDITDQRAAEARLQELNANLEQRVHERTRERDRIWTHSRDLLVTLDLTGVIQAVNPAFAKLLGFSQTEAAGRNVRDFIHPDDMQATLTALTDASAARALSGFQNRYVHKDGSLRTISWYTYTEAETIYAYGRDITAEVAQEETLRRTEEQLRQSQKMEAVGQLTGGIAHDFNNLLTGIAGSLELLDTRLAQGRTTDLSRYIAGAQGAARRAAALTQRLLAFSRRQTLDPRAIDANALVTGMDDLIRRAVGPAVQLKMAADPALWPCLVDPHQLENALLNLCINARDAMPDGGRLTIATTNIAMNADAAAGHDMPQGDYICLAVTDTGTGMTAEIAARAFDPFFTTKPLGEGTGLGLSMIYGFVRQSGGQVRIHTAPDQGTTICLYLPRSPTAVLAEPPAGPARHLPAAAARETVLVVDDEPTIRMLVLDVLEERGYRALEAADGAAGLRLLQSPARIDLLITDVGLPGGMNGRQLADAGRVLRPGLKVLFITGYAETVVLGEGNLEPGMAVLTKPFLMDTIGVRIRQLVEAETVADQRSG